MNANFDDAVIRHEAKMRVRKFLRRLAVIITVIVLICYAVNPALGIISMVVSGLYMLIVMVLSGFMYKREFKRVMKEQSEQAFASSDQTAQHIPARRREEQQSTMGTLDNPVVRMAASYAIGKAVLETSKKTESYQRNHRNPNADRYKKATHEAWESAGAKYRADERICATCAYWGGERQFVNSGNKKYVQPKRNAGSAKCSKMHRTIYTLSDHCSNWKGI